MKIVFPTNETFELTEELISSIFKDRRKNRWSSDCINLEYFEKIFNYHNMNLGKEIVEIALIKKIIKDIELLEWRWDNDSSKIQPYYTHEDIRIIEELLESLPAKENLLRIEQKKKLYTVTMTSIFSPAKILDMPKLHVEISPETKLYDLCWEDYTEKHVIQLLSEQSIDVNKQFSLGDTCLMRASRKGHLNLVRILLENHANRDLVDFMGKTASYYAVSKEIKDLIDNWPEMKRYSIKIK